MAQSLAQIIVHAVFSTHDRGPFLQDLELRQELHHYLGGILGRIDCQPIIVGGVEDHVHVLTCLSRTLTPAKMVQELKRVSSVWLKTKTPDMQHFAWQKGYGFFPLATRRVKLRVNIFALSAS